MGQDSYKNEMLVDLDFFESRRQVGEDFVIKLVEVFSQEAPKLIAKIKDAAEKQRGSELAELGHKLKGMCLNVGAMALSRLGRDIEHNAGKDNDDIVEILVKDVDTIFEKTLSTMKELV